MDQLSWKLFLFGEQKDSKSPNETETKKCPCGKISWLGNVLVLSYLLRHFPSKMFPYQELSLSRLCLLQSSHKGILFPMGAQVFSIGAVKNFCRESLGWDMYNVWSRKTRLRSKVFSLKRLTTSS